MKSNLSLLFKQFYCFTCIIIFLLFNNLTVHSATCEKHETAYLIASDSNTFFSQEILEEIASCAGFVILNTPLQTSANNYGLKKIITELHRQRGDLTILIYSWVSVWYERGAPRVGWKLMSGIQNIKSWYLEKRLDKNKQLVIFPDLRIKAYRYWIENQIIRTVNETGANGVFVDLAFRSPGTLIQICRKKPYKCKGYQAAFDELFAELKDHLNGKKLYFNGIFSTSNISLTDQLQILEHADGALIEYFGMIPASGKSNFDLDIEFYLEFIPLHPDKNFLFMARSPWRTKQFQTAWEQYLYAAYQLVAGKNTLFKYNSSFQAPQHAGDSDGLYLSPQLKLTLGEPVGRYSNRDGLYERYFTNGYVALCRHDYKGSVTTYIRRELYDDEGYRVSGEQHLQPGESLVLYTHP